MKLKLVVKSACFTIISMLLLTSCASRAHRYYSGPPLPNNEVALFYTVKGCRIWYLHNERENEGKLMSSYTELYELLPGQYIAGIKYFYLDIDYNRMTTWDGGRVQRELNVQAGNIYIIYAEITGWPHERTWRPIIVKINDYNKEECAKHNRRHDCPDKDVIRKWTTKYLQGERPVWPTPSTQPSDASNARAAQADASNARAAHDKIYQWESARLAEHYRELMKRAAQDKIYQWEGVAGPEPADLKKFRDCPDCPEMVAIPAGGTIERSFAIGKTEVTQGQWKAIMGNNRSEFSNCGDTCPVEQVSWNDVKEFIQKLNAKTGKQYRLPTEAEWEYACRAGGQQEYCGSDSVDSVAWYDGNSGGMTHPVARRQPNAFGLYDMSGNVWEWVEDCHGGDCSKRVLRGGSWVGGPRGSHADYRNHWGEPAFRFGFNGFRLASNVPP